MRKKGYKQMQKRLYREMNKATILKVLLDSAREDKEEEKKRADYFQERIRMIGANMATQDMPEGKGIATLRWELKPETWGTYQIVDLDLGYIDPEFIKEKVATEIAKGLIEKELVQFIVKDACMFDPLSRFGTIGGKVYVVPWEQMPHEPTIELKTIQANSLVYSAKEEGREE